MYSPQQTYAPAPTGAAGMAKGGFWIRLVAYIIDAIILSVISGIILGVINAVLPDLSIVGSLLSIVIDLAYVIYLCHNLGGATLGKKILGLRIVDEAGNVPSMGTIALRNTIGYLISGIILYIGFIMIGFDANKQGLHDKIAKTYVVKNSAR